jgi:NAD(P)-dependent dehydrogenase (short-subunit alcohol dehydrogenase family)
MSTSSLQTQESPAAIRSSPKVILFCSLLYNHLTLKIDETDEPAEPDLRIINIDFIGTAYTTKLALHYFVKSAKSDKCLILKSSLAGYLDLIGSPSYQSSKFAVRGLMCNLRRTDRCRVNLIAPWYVVSFSFFLPKQFEGIGMEETKLVADFVLD